MAMQKKIIEKNGQVFKKSKTMGTQMLAMKKERKKKRKKKKNKEKIAHVL
jgi:hypothetical protein